MLETDLVNPPARSLTASTAKASPRPSGLLFFCLFCLLLKHLVSRNCIASSAGPGTCSALQQLSGACLLGWFCALYSVDVNSPPAASNRGIEPWFHREFSSVSLSSVIAGLLLLLLLLLWFTKNLAVCKGQRQKKRLMVMESIHFVEFVGGQVTRSMLNYCGT